MAKTYKIENNGTRPTSFKVRGGVETVRAGQTRVLELREELDKEAVAQYAERDVKVSASSEKAENEALVLGGPISGRRQEPVKAAEKPAETGGVVPQSSVSERGGVARKPADTMTTTKPTTEQVGPKA